MLKSRAKGVELDRLDSIKSELEAAGSRELTLATDKKNYAESLSRGLAQRVANMLRKDFAGILPDETGKGQESRVRSAKGVKKLDVNYSTPELGLGLGISIKTVNFRDGGSQRYTKNYTRIDAELRAEAADYHVRQPYAVMIALIFLPLDACDDGKSEPSSFGQSVKTFRFRSGRAEPDDDPTLFERVFIGLYDASEDDFGHVRFFDVAEAPPKTGRPAKSIGFAGLVAEIRKTYDERNSPAFVWADAETEQLIEPVVDQEGEETLS